MKALYWTIDDFTCQVLWMPLPLLLWCLGICIGVIAL